MDYIMQIINTLHFSNLAWQVGAVFIFILGDFATGLISAVIQNNVDSKKMRQGLLRKILLVLIVFLSFVIEYTFSISVISDIVCAYIIIMEIISILENLKKAGIDLGKLGEILKEKGHLEEVENITVTFSKNTKEGEENNVNEENRN